MASGPEKGDGSVRDKAGHIPSHPLAQLSSAFK